MNGNRRILKSYLRIYVSFSLLFLSLIHSHTLVLIFCSCSRSPQHSRLDYQYGHVGFICGEFSKFLVITENLCAKFNSMNYMTNLQQCRRHQGDRETGRLSCQVSQQSSDRTSFLMCCVCDKEMC